MKLNAVKLSQVVLFSTLTLGVAIAAPEAPRPIPNQALFIPTAGFDDNDQVEFLLDGALPNSCYTLLDPTVSINSDTKSISVTHLMQKKDNKLCIDESMLPPHMQYEVPVSIPVRIGRLASGSYSIRAVTNPAVTFQVDKAVLDTQDEFNYANVTQAVVSPILFGKVSSKVVLKIQLPGDCVRLADRVEVIRQGNVFVMLPKLEAVMESSCSPNPSTVEKMIDLGILDEGRYAVHVRASGGHAVHGVFSVVAPRDNLPPSEDDK